MTSTYPDPAQLRTFVQEPMPFDDVLPKDLSLQDDARLVGSVENVEYSYHPTYIMVETELSEYERIEDTSLSYSHEKAWNRADNVQIEEDFICTTGLLYDEMANPHQFDAYWILETITIENPNLYA